MDYELKKVHEASLYILKEIDRICRKHGIQYALDAGTLIGAVRHKGFIPWDDDADVAFTRAHFQHFLTVAKDDLPEHLELLMPGDVGDGNAFYDFTPRILYLDSRVRNDNAEMRYYGGKLNHLWVDLFVIDEISANKVCRAWTRFQLKAVYGLAMGHRYHLDYEKYQGLEQVFVRSLAAVGRLVPMKVLRKWEQQIARKYEEQGSNLRFYSNYQPDYLYVTLDKEWCEDVVDMEFEGEQFMCPKGWDAVLRIVYGEYMVPPEPEKRVPAHSAMDEDGFYVGQRRN